MHNTTHFHFFQRLSQLFGVRCFTLRSHIRLLFTGIYDVIHITILHLVDHFIFQINAVESDEKELSPFKSIDNGCNEQEKPSKVKKSPGGSIIKERLSLAVEQSPVTTSSREHQPPETSKVF